MKIGKVRAWELSDTSSSSSSSVSGNIKEVEVGCICRRVQGENFTVSEATVASFQKDIQELAMGALHKHMESNITVKKGDDDALIGFKKISILADGLCFWHSVLRCSLPEEFDPIDRVASGGPRNKDRLRYEIGLAKTAHEECLELLKKLPGADPGLLSRLRDSPQVCIEDVHAICETSGLALRISLSEEAILITQLL